MPLALPTPDFEPSTMRLARHLATFRAAGVEPAAGRPAPPPPGDNDEAADPAGHPKLVLRQMTRVFGDRR